MWLKTFEKITTCTLKNEQKISLRMWFLLLNRINLSSGWYKLNFQFECVYESEVGIIRIKNQPALELIRLNYDSKLFSDSFRSETSREFSDWVRLIFNRFAPKKIQNIFQIGSKTNFGKALIYSDWILIRNLRNAR